jgi:hypothetical protein
MSFLDNNNSEYFSARITKKGRNAIAKGDFNINYFTIGDSEFVYSNEFSGITGSVTTSDIHQKVFSPMDKNEHTKYPIKYDDSINTIYGIPITGSTTEIVRNVMGSAGFVSDYMEYDNPSGSTIECLVTTLPFSSIDGSSTLDIIKPSGTTYSNCGYITLAFKKMQEVDDLNVISGVTNSLIYRLINVTGSTSGTTQTLVLDRNTPDLSSINGFANVICNKCEMEFDISNDVDTTCIQPLPDTDSQHNPWTLNILWSKKPIGSDVNGNDETLSGYTSNRFISAKEYLGYLSSSGQTFINYSGGTIIGTSYKDSFNNNVEIVPEEQKTIALIHFSEVGDIINDPDRFFKYDDYISDKTGITGNDISIVVDNLDNAISDTEYFQIYIPFIVYHRNSGTTIGSLFTMDTTDYYIKSTINELSKIKFRFLLDENGNKIGKVFVDKKVIVIDDEEIVATLDYRSNRKYTLPSPKITLTPSNDSSYVLNSTGQTMWVTYTLSLDSDNKLNALPCQYFNKVNGINSASNIGFKFNTEFSNLTAELTGITSNIVCNQFHILVQETNVGELPTPQNWYKLDYTEEAGGSSLSNLTGTTFIINEEKLNQGIAVGNFDLEVHMTGLTGNYMGVATSTDINVLTPQFGDEQPFPGSIRLIRSSDIEEMVFHINLPNNKFNISQNPTKALNPNMNPRVTEIMLLDKNKDVVVVAKTSKPVQRVGTQVFNVKLDF